MFLNDAPCRPTIAVTDKAKAMAYYGDVLGMTFVEENPVGATFKCGCTFLEIYPTPLAGTAKNTVAGFEVTDLEAAMHELRGQGVIFEEYDRPPTREGIAQLGPNRGAWFKDPDGNILALVQRGPG
ncbi:MAG: VOC family protein [Chloroflexota bacterium]|nr:VOC family protein [Chloroflexota bacterium]